MNTIEDKVSRLFHSRFGTSLKVHWTGPDMLKAHADNWKSAFVYSRTHRKVSFPIFGNNQELRGIATASPVNNDDAIQFQDMADYVRLTIGEFVSLEEKSDVLERTEQSMETAHNDSSKIIRWPSKPKSDEITYEEVEPQKGNPQDYAMPLWLYGEEAKTLQKVAGSCHDWAKNWAFFNGLEIPDLIWRDNPDWMEFGQVTILLPEADTWTPQQWQVLESNLRRIRANLLEAPLIIITSRGKPNKVNSTIKTQFKTYKVSETLSPKVQSHFLLYHHRHDQPWLYRCSNMNQLFFLPFSKSSELLH